MDFYRTKGKALVDVLLAGPALLLATPFLLLGAAAVWVSMGRPILYRQQRAGRNGRPFPLFKLRTMRPGVDSRGLTLPDSARITPTGSWLRRWSLDELPQLMNVLRGEMSLVGPRPLLLEYLDRYTPQQARRHQVRPGITGLAQIEGRNAIGWPERLALDVRYVEELSPALDASILWRTILLVLRGDGLSAPGHATMPHFTGSQASETEPEPPR